MPHLTVKHFPKSLTPDQRAELAAALTAAVQKAFACDEGVVSIALHPVDPDLWDEQVYRPEITDRRDALIKTPDY
ncbi:tautomerase family protein [Streptomyces pratensis]|uniref:tautomerase family protein n=1 Tax=Streptomyces pratensis TaxID=1169025 RepID=UPI003018ADD6